MLYIMLMALCMIVASSGALWLVLTDCLKWKATGNVKVLLSILWVVTYILVLTVLGQIS